MKNAPINYFTGVYVLLFVGFPRGICCFVVLLSTCKAVTYDKRHLGTIPTDIHPDTTSLTIRYDDVHHIPTGAFSTLTTLAYLEVSRSNVRFVSDGAFSGLDALTTLRLYSNRIHHLPDLGDIADTLTILTLDNNPIVLENLLVILTPLLGLEELGLNYCGLSRLTALPALTNLKNLWMKGNQISHLNPTFFSLLVNLERFNMAHNQLTQMDFTFPASLNELSWYDNRIPPVTRANMSSLVGVKWLNLGKNNKVSSLPDGTFADLPILNSLFLQHLGLIIVPDLSDVADTLTHLYLDYNKITLNNTYNLFGLNELQHLSLHHCRLSGNLTFPTFPHMTHLYLEHNQLTKLSPDVFKGYDSLNYLNLQNNEINILGIPTDFPTTLQHLDLSTNEITRIPNDTFGRHQTLTFLGVSNNPLTNLHESIFHGSVSLNELKLDNNALDTLETRTFQEQAHLTKLYLNNNQLTTLARGMFVGLGRLVYLYLQENSIQNIEEGAFNGLYRLQELHLHSNALETFPEMTDSAGSLIVLQVNNNPRMTYMNASHLVNFNRLRFLNVHSCSLGGDLDLPLLPALLELDANSNNFTGINPKLFRGFRTLNHVDLRWNRFVKLPLFENSSGASDIALNGQNLTHVGIDKSFILDLEHNQISAMPSVSISMLTRGLIKLNGNPIDCTSLCWMFDCRNRTFHGSNVDLLRCHGNKWYGMLWTSSNASYVCPRKLELYLQYILSFYNTFGKGFVAYMATLN